MAIYQGFHAPFGGSQRAEGGAASRMHASVSGLDSIPGCFRSMPGRGSRRIAIIHNGRMDMRKVVAIENVTLDGFADSQGRAGLRVDRSRLR